MSVKFSGSRKEGAGHGGFDVICGLQLPEDIVLAVLCQCPPKQVIQCRRVCKYWRDLVDTKNLWWTKYERVLARQGLARGEDLDIRDLQMICIHQPFNRNLLKNWNAEEGMKHWEVRSNGGDGFLVEQGGPHYDPLSTISDVEVAKCWVTSYGPCIKSQVVDLCRAGCPERLLQAGRVSLHVSDWTAALFDCGSRYNGRVSLRNNLGKVIAEEEEGGRERTVGQWQDRSWKRMEWHFPDLETKGDTYVAFVEITHGGSDTWFCAGHYGPRLAAPSIHIELQPAATRTT